MKFLLDPEGILRYINSSENSEILGNNVSIYDYAIDLDNSIHLVYLQNSGILNYKIKNGEKTTEAMIGKFDTKSNLYNQISILIIKGKINLIYSFTNVVNSNIVTLHHVVISNNTQDRYNIIRYVSKKDYLSYVVDNDSNGNIHLFYNTVTDNFSYIYYTYFNPYKNQWLNNPIKLSSAENHCEYPSILVDHKDIIHGIWWERRTNGYILKYKRMSTFGSDMYKWLDINIPTVIQNVPYSKIYNKNGNIYIECSERLLISYDSGIHWTKEVKENDSNIPLNANNHSNLESYNTQNNENTDDIIENNYAPIEFHNNKIEQILFNQEEIILLLKNVLDEQHLLESRISKIEELIKSQRGGFKKLFSS
ncbi:hypothetical protein [Tissierella sp. Yu-01]|uniref:hypothetical protein n=1 Tax=Tissierella sp. Yu-01 TaxID=3035694 RepID=UPI00240DABC7|nr:hypothetical protein [Tissierella sp. Yu-01]WFA09653.1 hypothetical protein P3962_03600 [Tissierella sp. Yu-01]